MATLKQKAQCEQDALEFVKEFGLPEPDHVEYGFTCIRLFWEEPKTVLVIDIDEPDALVEAAVAHEEGARSGDNDDEDEEDHEEELD